MHDGLPCIDMRIPMDADLENYPHVFLTADSTWDPSVLDNEFDEQFCDTITELPEVKERRDGADPCVDNCGFPQTWEDCESLFCTQDEFIAANSNTTNSVTKDVYYDTSASGVTYYDDTGAVIHDYVLMTYFETMVATAPNRVWKLFPDLERLKPFFGWASTDKIKTMLDKTTQHYHGVIHFPFCKHFKSQCPGANVPCLNKWMAMDTFFNNTPAMDDGIPGHGGCTMMQIFYRLCKAARSDRCANATKIGSYWRQHTSSIGSRYIPSS